MGKMNRFSRWSIDRRTRARARRVLSSLAPQLRIPSGAAVLELGSGGGGLLAMLYERYHPARLVGTDFDEAQVDATREYLTGRWGELPGGVELRQADALAIPFPNGSFDLVFAMAMLHHVEEHFREYIRRPQALREILRVLRPGGSLVYSDFFRRDEIRGTLDELGFSQEFLRSGWRSDTGIYRAPAGPADPGIARNVAPRGT